MSQKSASRNNTALLIGTLLLCVGLQFANYGTSICVSSAVMVMDALPYYALISAMGTLGMMLVLPVVGKLTAILGLRTLIAGGILVQFLGRLLMIFCGHWIPYSIGMLVQAIGGGMYVSAPFVVLAGSVKEHDRARYFGYIAVANAVGAVFGPLLISAMLSAGGILASMAYIANLPLSLAAYLLIMKKCPNNKTPGAAKGFDYPGLFLSVIGIAGLILWLNLAGKMFAWISMPSLLMAVTTALCLVLVFQRELKIDAPAIPLKMFKNSRLTYAFIGAMVSSAFSSCVGAYCVMWIRMNYQGLPTSTFFNGTGTMSMQVVIFILGLFLGRYISQKFVLRFRVFAILSMLSAVLSTAVLFCLKFTGTAAGGDVLMLGSSFPLGMLVIYVGTGIGGLNSVVQQSTYSVFWQSNTPKEDIPSGQGLYNFAGFGGACIFSAVVGAMLGSSTDYTLAFAVGFVFSIIGLICAYKGFRFSKEELEAARNQESERSLL